MSSEDLQKLAELRSQIEEKLEALRAEEKLYMDMLAVIDSILKKESFVKAVQMPTEGQKEEEAEIRQLKRPKDGAVLGTVKITKDQAIITPAPELGLRAEVAPFRSFFVNKILEGYRSQDREDVEEGKLGKDEAFNYDLDIENGLIQKIVIKNYRTQARLNEIINTASWTFSKMLEKASQ